jgi:hypothetical protein
MIKSKPFVDSIILFIELYFIKKLSIEFLYQNEKKHLITMENMSPILEFGTRLVIRLAPY